VAVSEILPAHPLETEDSYLADMIRTGPWIILRTGHK
jgi:hypothetical protein